MTETIDEKWLEENAKIGMDAITPADLPIPVLTLVQTFTKDVDLKTGEKAKPGTYYHDLLKEAFEKPECSLLVVKPGKVPTFGKKGEFDNSLNFIGVLDKSQTPFMFSCKKSAYLPAQIFIGEIYKSGKPLFAYNTIFEAKEVQWNGKSFYTPVFKEWGLRKDNAELLILRDLANKYSAKKVEEELAEEQKKIAAFDNYEDE